ncbi:uracil-DNA glycosylase family protein [Leptotrichia sp. oral taxon 215 str. W9775]|uniref:uracil-DNA glycosylase n=1 Tax=Leptotrichia sp. oral taxon 215 TaxID=712359 RepID=UPI0003AE2DB0|nr:uracil-DNA glycosylase [Leptotrichia sp. oral taxon 215]ERK68164.1 uracil-DNA glycosylase family protein [Leptotrichia sp. oral taxon 215 str. W9775]
MKTILEDNISYDTKIKDFGVDSVNKRIITTGDKLIFLKEGKIEKEVAGKIKNCEVIRYIKEKNQLFVSSIFFVSTQNGKVYKCDGRRKKIIEEVYDFERTPEVVDFTTGGKIIFIENNTLCSYDVNTKESYITQSFSENMTKGNYRIFTSGENVILKYRELHEKSNKINIFDSKLEKIFDIKTENNHIYSKIVGIEYLAGTDAGEIEIWNIIESEMYNSIKISNSRITFIEKNDKNYFIGTGTGDLIITDETFKIQVIQNIFKNEITKICVIEDEIFVLGVENKIVKLKIIDETNEVKNNIQRMEFMEKYNIHEDYYDFFTVEKVTAINSFIKCMEIRKIEYIPKNEYIFKSLRSSISSRKVCILSNEPYSQGEIATGLAFEVKNTSWVNHEINISLKNILKLLYKTYNGKMEDIEKIRKEISHNEFNILPPNELFKSWEKQGVLLLNSSLTAIEEKTGEHNKFWHPFTRDLIEYISTKNENIVYFLWGKDAEQFEKNILNGEIIKSNHPAKGGHSEGEKDFLKGDFFEKTKDMINWLGIKEII